MESVGTPGHGPNATSEHMHPRDIRTGPPKGRGAKAPKPRAAKRALKLSVSSDVYERLAIHGIRRDQTISEIVSDLAIRYLNDVILHAKPGPRSEAV